MEIIYQKNKDKQPVYDMYQKIFEDPEPFAQYYFEEIYATNQVILAEEDNKILGSWQRCLRSVSMICMSSNSHLRI